MPVATTTDFVETLRKSGLLDAKDLDAAIASYPGSLDDTSKLIEHLVDKEIITKFQAKSLLNGRYRGLIIGPYKILDRIGAGGMGIVYLAQHMKLDRRVAIKVLPEDKTKDKLALERFYREARAVAALDHPNIVKAFDVAEHEGMHYFVMEYIDGANLQRYLDTKGPLPWKTAVNVAMQACKGLQQAHERGLVHRDIKPANILVDKAGQVKILDLGLARSFDEKKDNLTQDLSDGKDVMGSIDYIAPEQAIANKPVDIRADIYSLGATLYALITGRPPVEGTTAQKLLQHQVQMPTPVHKVKSDVPEGISTVMAKMMAKKPEHRFATPNDVIAAFTPFVTNAPQLFPQLGQTQFGTMPITGPISGPISGPMMQRSGPVPTAPLLRDPPTQPRQAAPVESKRDTDRIRGKTKKFKSKKSRKKGRNTTLYAVIGTAAVLIPAISIFFIFMRSSKPDEVTKTENTAPARTTPQPTQPANQGPTEPGAVGANPNPTPGNPGTTTNPGDPNRPRRQRPGTGGTAPQGGAGPGSQGPGNTTPGASEPGKTGGGNVPPPPGQSGNQGGFGAAGGGGANTSPPGSKTTPPTAGSKTGPPGSDAPPAGTNSTPGAGGRVGVNPGGTGGTPPGTTTPGSGKSMYVQLTPNYRVQENGPMADIAGEDWDETGLRLADYEGKVVILDFWNFWTTACVKALPFKKDLCKKYKDRSFAYLGVNTDKSKGEHERNMKKYEIPWRNFKDRLPDNTLITKRFGLVIYPSLIVIDHRGQVKRIVIGPIKDPAEFETFVDKLVEKADKAAGGTPGQP